MIAHRMNCLLWFSTRSEPGYRRVNGGWREEGLSRYYLATDSVWSKLPPLSVPVSPSPVSREASRYSVALDMWLHTRYQVSKIDVWYHGIFVIFGGFGLTGLGWVGFNDLFSGFGKKKYYTWYSVYYYTIELQQ